MPAAPSIPEGWILEPEVPSGWIVEEEAEQPAAPVRGMLTGMAYDGDTVRLQGGANGRVLGIDAFELDQTGQRGSEVVPLGVLGRNTLRARISPKTPVALTGKRTYGRPVVTLGDAANDPALGVVEAGLALPMPNYLRSDPERFDRYVATQRDAIAAERGAYGGTYQRPDEYRKQGDKAPLHGKIAMTPQQKREYGELVRNPETTPEQLTAWAASQGHVIGNAENILSFSRKNPSAGVADYFQQQDAMGEPVLRDGPNIITRGLAAVNEGIVDLAATPFDLAHTLAKPVGEALGVEMGDTSILGDWLRDSAHDIGVGQTDESYAPRSDAERYGQAVLRGVGQSVVPAGGMAALGGRLALRGASAATAASPARTAVRNVLVEAGKRPGLVVAGEVGAGAGSGAGSQVADDVAPGNPWAQVVGQLLGGVVGGVTAGVPVSSVSVRKGAPPSKATPGSSSSDEIVRTPDEVFAGAPTPEVAQAVPQGDYNYVDQDGALVLNVSDDGVAHAVQSQSAAHGKLAEFHSEGDNRFLTYTTPEGEVANIHVRLAENGDAEISIDPFSREPNRFGPAAIRDAARQLQEAYPEIRRVYGERETGAGPGRIQSMDMANETDIPSISAPAEMERVRDIIDVNDPRIPEGWVVEDDVVPGRARPLLDQPTPAELTDAVQRIEPRDVTPIPANEVESVEEAAAIGAGMRPLVEAVDETQALETRWTPSPRDATRQLPHKGPLDMVSWLRTQGGIKPQGGELAAMGIDNSPRGLDFAQGEGRMGQLVNVRDGMTLDEAADAAWRAGYIDSPERPTIDEFLDALSATHSGRNRAFLENDLPEIDRFYAERDQRYRVMQADAEGAPLAEDRGQPIGPDDLDANAPPVTAYEDLPRVGGKVANINLANIETRGDIRRLLKATEDGFGGFDAARRGRISQGETEALASELGMTADSLLKRRNGQALNAEEALAARQILAKSSDEMLGLARKAQGGSDDDLLAFQQAMLRHAAIQEQVTGATAEAGRALAQFKMSAKAKAANFRVHKAMIEAGSGREGIEDAAKAILDMQRQGVDPGTINKYALDATKPIWKDKAVELWYNYLLSGFQTHAVNVTSNAMTAALQIPEFALASALGQVSKLRGGVDRVTAREIVPRMVGMIQGVREGLPVAWKALKTGDVPDFVTKVEARTQKAIGGKLGEVVRVPTKMLAAEDEMFKSIARRSSLNGLAVRKAVREGLKGGDFYARVADLQANPTNDMIEQSLDYARYVTFQTPLEGLPLRISQATRESRWLKAFIPFVRTPVNILRFATERSPAAPALKTWRDDFRAGGARRQLAIAKWMVGVGISAQVMKWAHDGAITGSGPLDPNAERIMRADGWQPNSFKIGDRYYSYARLDPLALTFGVAADMSEKSDFMTEKQRENSAELLVASVINNLANKTWMSGVSDVTQAMADWQRYGDSFTNRLVSSAAVPSVMANIARTQDPVLRDARTLLDAVKVRVPGLSTGVKPKRDIWGAEIVREGGLGPDITSPIATGTAKNDILNAEMLRIGARISKPKRDTMTPDQFDAFQSLAGVVASTEIRTAMTTQEWKQASDADRKEMAEDIVRKVRKEAKETVLGTTPKKERNSVADLSTPGNPVIPNGWVVQN